jgi:hypothetical protein
VKAVFKVNAAGKENEKPWYHAPEGRGSLNIENGHEKRATKIELQDRIVVETRPDTSPPSSSGEQFEFEVVGIVEDAESSAQYAVCYSEGADEFIVTNAVGELLDDDTLAQEILGDFLDQAADSEEEAT